MHIDFILDTVCAWSYIAKRRLDEALLSFPKLKADISVHPFLISPPSSLHHRYPENIIGTLLRTREMQSKIEPAALETGLNFAFDSLPLVTDSMASHILIHHAFAHNKGMETLEAVFNSYFCQAKNISDINVLIQIAHQCDLDTDAFVKELETKSLETALPLFWKHSGVRGIPCLIFNKKTLISGAQSADVIKRMIELYLVLRQESKENAVSPLNYIENQN